jgi:predicted NUDIX family NTP pyrophosphohydrolase
VLLVHPGGPFWTNKDDAAWSIPKGEIADGEAPFEAAVREFEEEMGTAVNGEFIPLPACRQAGGKLVLAWAVEADLDPSRLKSNTFTMEWPPRSGRQRAFPEIDRAAWFPLDVARQKVVRGQQGLLDELESRLT